MRLRSSCKIAVWFFKRDCDQNCVNFLGLKATARFQHPFFFCYKFWILIGVLSTYSGPVTPLITFVSFPTLLNQFVKMKIVQISAALCDVLPKFALVCIPPLAARRNMLTRHKDKASLFFWLLPLVSYAKRVNQLKSEIQLIYIWMDRSGTVGLNSSTVATSFTHDFPVRAVFMPVSCSHRFDARNTEITANTETHIGSIRMFCVYSF